MTFRSRLVLASATAVVVAVVLGSIASYVVSYRSLMGSTDTTIGRQARDIVATTDNGVPPLIPNTCLSTGQCIQVVWNNGAVHAPDAAVIPIPTAVKAVAASRGSGPEFYLSTTVNHGTAREVVLPLPVGFTYRSQFQYSEMYAGGALQLTAPLNGVNDELGHLALALWIIAILGVALAIALGFGVGRAALGPLNSLTDTVEGLARDTDVSRRLDPGGPDELGRLRRAFNRLLQALESSREAQRQLVLDASHELRTPLTSLRTNMEVARRLDELSPPDRDVLIGDVLTQLDELTTLVGDLAELARGEQPRTAAESFRLDALVEELIAVATTHGRSRGVTFALLARSAWVSGSRGRIERAIGNLLDNAMKWSPDGGAVEVGCGPGVVTVRDHGTGVSPEDRAHIFDRFYRAAEARGRPGSGLGLAIVAQVARDEGGSVEVLDADGGGALFVLRLPDAGGPVAHPAGGGPDGGGGPAD